MHGDQTSGPDGATVRDILHNVLNLTLTRVLNVLLHTCKFLHTLTDLMQLKCRLAYQSLNFLTPTL